MRRGTSRTARAALSRSTRGRGSWSGTSATSGSTRRSSPTISAYSSQGPRASTRSYRESESSRGARRARAQSVRLSWELGSAAMRLAWVSFGFMGRDCPAAAARAGAEVAAVVTLPGPIEPDRSGQCSFHEIAAELGARLIETADVNSPETIAALREAEPDMIFVVGWSQLVLDEFIRLPPQGVFGMHPTLLPKHRGRAAIPWAILNGLAKTGVTLFEISDGTADSGAIVGQVEVPIARDETAPTLYAKVTEAHLELVRRCVPELLDGSEPRIAPDPRRAAPRRARAAARQGHAPGGRVAEAAPRRRDHRLGDPGAVPLRLGARAD